MGGKVTHMPSTDRYSPLEDKSQAKALSDIWRDSLTESRCQDRDYQWEKIIRAIHGMLALHDDWDGLGAKSPSSDIIFYAMRLADAKRQSDYAAPTRVAATPAGTIGLEWQQGSIYTEAEIVAPYRSEWMQIIAGTPTKHWSENERYERDESYSPIEERVDTTAEDLTSVCHFGRIIAPVYIRRRPQSRNSVFNARVW
jgi:hypothetical protein